MVEFSEILTEVMDRLNLNDEDCSTLFGVSTTAVTAYRTGESTPHSLVIARFYKVLLQEMLDNTLPQASAS